jgi:ArsR family transcriptional regulator, lead/cadmium/zinc/bismuth-responsive transcriptional repressor
MNSPLLSPSDLPLAAAPASPPVNASGLDDGDIAQLADMFRLLGDPTRLKLVLACMTQQTASAGALAEAVGASPSLVSHHLRLLKAARLVSSKRDGKQIFYQISDAHIQSVLRDMIDHLQEDHDA